MNVFSHAKNAIIDFCWSAIWSTLPSSWYTARPVPRLQLSLPKVVSRVPGFTVNVERKEGCVFSIRSKGSSEDTPYIDAGTPEHFEVTATCSGNVHYPEARGPWKKLLTNTNDRGRGSGFWGGVVFFPPGVRFTKIEIVEEYEDHRYTEWFGHGRPGPEMIVWLAIHVRGDAGPLKMGLATRPVAQTEYEKMKRAA